MTQKHQKAVADEVRDSIVFLTHIKGMSHEHALGALYEEITRRIVDSYGLSVAAALKMQMLEIIETAQHDPQRPADRSIN